MNGLLEEWHENGQKMVEVSFLKMGKKKESLLLGMRMDQKRKSFWANDSPNGPLTRYYPNGQLKEKVNTVNGQANGLLEGWYEEWQKQGEKFLKGVQISEKSWYPNGQISADVSLKNGKINDGLKWQPNGEICPISSITNGNGVWVLYNDDGTEKEINEYKNGIKVEDLPVPLDEKPNPAVFPE